ncbi:hypothetical protein DPM19_30570 [Actinomadura craniellae]|uniref:Uncharacterized protein n=1 Tax=Actinomadura craniellae TaxID=2231787 RepID=A0A365GX15_9ACTN|nr:hypothetical protein [Actinomadura craniellae]RAY11371.1 hypothetical protein DPM19_30570 [Actinomadura craniellae]
MRPDGGDPERDDYGLPHVDVVIPDDARELDREVLAYRREERRRRRQDRLRRVFGPFARFGLAAPALAIALLIAVAGGAIFAALTPRPSPRPTVTSTLRDPTAPPGGIGGPLPAAQVTVAGRARPVGDVAPGVIMIVPPDCRCENLVAGLAGQTRRLNLKFWLAADRRSGWPAGKAAADLRGLAGRTPPGQVVVVGDERNVLAATYRPVPGAAPSAVLVHTDAVVGAVITPTADSVLTERLRSLTRPSRP